jgi:hypothetical protein
MRIVCLQVKKGEKRLPGKCRYTKGRTQQDLNKMIQKIASNTYVFQIELAETEGKPSGAVAAGRLPAIIVEVRPEGLRQAGVAGPERDKAERAAAESVARTAAPEALANLIPPGSKLVYIIAQLGQLPESLCQREPNLRKSGVNAWLLPKEGSAI